MRQHAIPDALWHILLLRYPFLRRLPPDEAALRRLTSLFLSRKEFHTVGGLTLTDEMAVTIAAQACLPVLKLGLAPYDSFVGIVVQADEVMARRVVEDENGLVHEYDEELVGEAMEGGPVMLSWREVRDADLSAHSGANLVIHEFAHVLDLADGVCDGTPPMHTAEERKHWQTVIQQEYASFCQRVDAAEKATALVPLLDTYGAQGIEEFFPVACEAFFTLPRDFSAEHPVLYGLFSRYFQQRP